MIILLELEKLIKHFNESQPDWLLDTELKKEILSVLNNQLKMVENLTDFNKLKAIMDSFGMGLSFSTKLGRHDCFSFDIPRVKWFNNSIIDYPEFASYLIDGISLRGKCRWKNLYKYIKIEGV